MKRYTHMSHDAVFKKFLTHPDTAREFLGIHLPSLAGLRGGKDDDDHS
jgi:hypothetical protein